VTGANDASKCPSIVPSAHKRAKIERVGPKT
jgi:hypothetical protein